MQLQARRHLIERVSTSTDKQRMTIIRARERTNLRNKHVKVKECHAYEGAAQNVSCKRCFHTANMHRIRGLHVSRVRPRDNTIVGRHLRLLIMPPPEPPEGV